MAHVVDVAEFVQGAFGELGFPTLEKMGFNRQMHYRLASLDELQGAQRRMQPHVLFGEKTGGTSLLLDSAVQEVKVRGKRAEAASEHLDATVAVSNKVEPGIFVGTNEHFKLPSEEEGGEWLLEQLRLDWLKAQLFARDLGIAAHNKLVK